MSFSKLFYLVTMATTNLALIQSCYDIYFSQLYMPKQYEEGSIHIILDVGLLAVLSFYRILPTKC